MVIFLSNTRRRDLDVEFPLAVYENHEDTLISSRQIAYFTGSPPSWDPPLSAEGARIAPSGMAPSRSRADQNRTRPRRRARCRMTMSTCGVIAALGNRGSEIIRVSA